MPTRNEIPAEICKPCWERYRRNSAVYRIGMCRDCFSGKSGYDEGRRASLKAAWARPGARDKWRAAMKSAWAKPGAKERRRAAWERRRLRAAGARL